MKIHEYQAKEILKKVGIPVPNGQVCFSVAQAQTAATNLGGTTWVVKAQIHAGGRGKGGGVKLARSAGEVEKIASQILGMHLVTKQSLPEGCIVRRLLIEEAVDIANELYVAMVVDRESQQVVLVASPAGGGDIEEIATRSPEKIFRLFIDPANGLTELEAIKISTQIGIPESLLSRACALLKSLYRAFIENDASLLEINPLVVTRDHRLIALDAKLNFDDNALFRHKEWATLRDLDEEDPAEVEAAKFELNYISLDGNIGCLVNGAGLAMATMDIIKLYGGSPANFLDVGGGATPEKVTEAFKLMLSNAKVKAILVNIFGGIMQCDVIAQGLVVAAREVNLSVPLIVRFEGTRVDLGRKILSDSGLAIIAANNMADAADKAVRAARG